MSKEDVARAAQLARALALESAGRLVPALDVYLELGANAHAARVARRLGRLEEAADLYLSAGMPFEAAECSSDGGQPARGLELLLLVRPEDPQYRRAAAEALRAAPQLDIALEHFLLPFLETAPLGAEEVPPLLSMVELKLRQDDRAGARELLERILRFDPAETKARAIVESLARQAAPAPEAVPALPELPLPPKIGRPAKRTAPALPEAPSGREPPRRAEPLAETVPLRVTGRATPPADAGGAPSGLREGPPARITERARATGGSAAAAPERIGRYHLQRVLGRGGMATVYAARDQQLGLEVAIKIFQPPAHDVRGSALRRFKQEVALTRGLNHENVIRIFDIGEDGGRWFLSMELLSGRDLKQRAKERPIPMERGLDYLLQAASGLAFAHAQGIIHRDIKPANLFVTEQGVLKLMDFGIAKSLADSGATTAGLLFGTPRYMSPEQISGAAPMSSATDLYSLGAVAYELFTQEAPFVHTELTQLLTSHLLRAPKPPRSINPEIPESLEAIILRLLEKDPERRYQSCGELIEALRRVELSAR
jgi:serine/threonine-protein kinase